VSERYSLPGEHRERDRSGHGKKVRECAALTGWRVQRARQSGQGKKASKPGGTLTYWRGQRE